MKATELLDHFHARAQPQVEGVAQANLGAGVSQCLGRHGFNRAIGAYGHKGRGVYLAVGQGQSAAAGGAIGGDQIKFHRACSILDNSMASP